MAGVPPGVGCPDVDGSHLYAREMVMQPARIAVGERLLFQVMIQLATY
jgi:hypothetical protein